jgi:insertion element IS1 protein InsB
VPAHMHVETKSETAAIEGLNSRIRHYLARFHRKTLCYSKAIHMVQATLTVFFTNDWIKYLY